MAAPLSLAIDPTGSLQQVLATLGQAPANLKRAQARAMRRFLSWIQREALRAASAATGVTQKALRAMVRYRAGETKAGGIAIWIGTNPIKVHHLGTVRWTRQMAGARAGKRLFPGSWSWGPGSKTGGVVMERTGQFDSNGREAIAPVRDEIHDAVKARIEALQPAMQDQLMRYMLTAVKEQIFQESKAAA